MCCVNGLLKKDLEKLLLLVIISWKQSKIDKLPFNLISNGDHILSISMGGHKGRNIVPNLIWKILATAKNLININFFFVFY